MAVVAAPLDWAHDPCRDRKRLGWTPTGHRSGHRLLPAVPLPGPDLASYGGTRDGTCKDTEARAFLFKLRRWPKAGGSPDPPSTS